MEPTTTRELPSVMVDYDTPVEQKVPSGGIHTPHINQSNFPCERTGKRNASPLIVNFGERVRSSDEAARRIREDLHLRPGHPTELADISRQHPRPEELASCFPLVAVEVFWEQDPHPYRYAVYLRGAPFAQQLYLLDSNLPLYPDCWLLAFRE